MVFCKHSQTTTTLTTYVSQLLGLTVINGYRPNSLTQTDCILWDATTKKFYNGVFQINESGKISVMAIEWSGGTTVITTGNKSYYVWGVNFAYRTNDSMPRD